MIILHSLTSNRDRILRYMAVIVAVAWVGIGYTSRNAYVLDVAAHGVWIMLSGLAAGSALAVARWGSLYALQSYTIITASIAVLRSSSYAMADVWGPMWVWLLTLSLTVVVYLAFESVLKDRRRTE